MALTDSITEAFAALNRLTAQTVENYRAELALIDAEVSRLNERAAQIRSAMAEIGAEEAEMPATANPKRSAATTPSAKMGDKIVAYLRSKPGVYVASAEIAAAVGTPKVSTVLAEAADAALVERKGAGRRMEYRIKK